MTDKHPIGPTSVMVPTVHLRWNNAVLEQLWQDANGFSPSMWQPVPTASTQEGAP